MLNYNNIKIAMLELSDQNRAVLDYYFSSAGKDLFTLVDEDEADAFITDYDYPGAKGFVEKILSTNNKPMIIMSVREQQLPLTVWLAKPITGTALAETADSLQELILRASKNEVETVEEVIAEEELIDECSSTEALDTEILSTEDLTTEILVTENLPSEDLVCESLAFEGSQVEMMDTEVELDTLETLTTDSLIAEAATIEAEIAEDVTTAEMPVMENTVMTLNNNEVTSATVVSMPVLEKALSSDSSNDIFDMLDLDEESIELDENQTVEARLAMVGAAALISATAAAASPETETESEVDALLESLILGEGNKTHKDNISGDITGKTDTETSIGLDHDIFTENLTLDDELNTDSSSELGSELDKDTSAKEKTVLLKENKLNIEDDHDSSLDEDFIMHDDLNPSDEDVYAKTLEINYVDIKNEDSETFSAINMEVGSEESLLQINEDSIEIETLEEEVNDLAEIEKLNETVDTISPSLDSTLEILDDNLSSEKANIDTLLDEEAEDELNNLLKEISSKPENSTKASEDIAIVSSFIDKTLAIEDDFDDGLTNGFDDLDGAIKNKDGLPPFDKETEEFDLQSLLNEVREEADSGPLVKSEAMNGFEQTYTEKRWMQLCGNYESITTQKEMAKITFTLKNHLLDVLLKQIEATKGSEKLYRIKYNDLIIVLDHSQASIYCNLPVTSDEYSETCFTEIDHKQIKVHDLDYSEVKLYRDKIEDNPDRSHSIESFIWSTSLLTSRGRLPAKTDVTKKIGLKMWPNLTRVELPPNAMQIAAVFSKNPGNLLEISEWIRVEQRYVFAFYNAALSLDMIELDSNKLKKVSFNLGKKNSKNKPEERSFFSRLLKRLKS